MSWKSGFYFWIVVEPKRHYLILSMYELSPLLDFKDVVLSVTKMLLSAFILPESQRKDKNTSKCSHY